MGFVFNWKSGNDFLQLTLLLITGFHTARRGLTQGLPDREGRPPDEKEALQTCFDSSDSDDKGDFSVPKCCPPCSPPGSGFNSPHTRAPSGLLPLQEGQGCDKNKIHAFSHPGPAPPSGHVTHPDPLPTCPVYPQLELLWHGMKSHLSEECESKSL